MKTINEIENSLKLFDDKYSLGVVNAEQGSGLWLQMKLGVLSASNAYKIVAKKDSQTRWTYIYDLIAQVASGVSEEINSKYLEYGRTHEETARALYEMHTNKKLSKVSFIFGDRDFRTGCSPDDVVDGQHGLELKVPYNPSNYAKFLCDDYINSEYDWQCQFSMKCSGAERWDYANFSPVFKVKPIKILPIKRDAEKQKKLDDAVPEFIHDMDIELNKIGLKFGCQWERLKC